ncbi:hypothetical protein [Sunxiuqinia sp. sy24]|uniref:hypothetical protein n=1 Tax=Sunxiuqinia sp. sy24 TaxID=3461495 RepID=UPI004045EED5
MRKFLLLTGLLVLSVLAFSQTSYKYVIIPTQFPDFADGLNPYGLSSSIQNELNAKSIENTFQSELTNDDFCDVLTVSLMKVNNMFKNKLKVELKDCRNRVVWSQEGTGRSKDFQKGYAEALAEAFKDLDKLPINPNSGSQAAVAPASTPAQKIEPAAPVAQPQTNESEALYKPGNLFYNYTYFIDLVDLDGDQKQLILLNGKLLGYDDLQAIGSLAPSGIADVYTLEWTTTNGETIRGLANLTAGELKISLPKGDQKEVITLHKY